MQFIGKIDRALAKIEEILLALMLVGMVVLAGVQVLLRNIWNTSIDWADIGLQNVTVLVGLLGAAIATSEGLHLNIDVVGRLLKGRKAFLLRVVIGIFALIICGLLAKGGWTNYKANLEPWLANVPEGWTAAHALKEELAEGTFPQWLTQLMFPIGFSLIGFHFFLRLIRDFGSLITGKSWEDEGGDIEGDAYLDALMEAGEDIEADGDESKPKESGDAEAADDQQKDGK